MLPGDVSLPNLKDRHGLDVIRSTVSGRSSKTVPRHFAKDSQLQHCLSRKLSRLSWYLSGKALIDEKIEGASTEFSCIIV